MFGLVKSHTFTRRDNKTQAFTWSSTGHSCESRSKERGVEFLRTRVGVAAHKMTAMASTFQLHLTMTWRAHDILDISDGFLTLMSRRGERLFLHCPLMPLVRVVGAGVYDLTFF